MSITNECETLCMISESDKWTQVAADVGDIECEDVCPFTRH